MEKASEKLKVIKDHLGHATDVEPKVVDLGGPDAVKPKYEYFKMNGWGYHDTKITFDREKNYGFITGSRYTFSGSQMRDLQKFAESEVNLRVSEPPVTNQETMTVDPPFINEAFLAEIEGSYSRLSFDPRERTTHSHGHTLLEVFTLKHGKFDRFVDCVIYPGSHEQVEALVKAAMKHNVVLIPYGGGTNVTQALMVTPEEKRMIVSVDMTRVCFFRLSLYGSHRKNIDESDKVG